MLSWLQSEEHATLDLRVMSSSPMLSVAITYIHTYLKNSKLLLHNYIVFLKVYLLERERVYRSGRDRGREADSLMNVEPNMGFDPTNPRS